MYTTLSSSGSPLTTYLADLPYTCRDPFHVGHFATYTLRHLKIICKVDRYGNFYKCKSRNQKNYTHTSSEGAYIHREIIRDELEPLLRVAKKRSFQLELVLVQRNVCVEVLSDMLDTFTDVHSAFETAGADVKVTWQSRLVSSNASRLSCRLSREVNRSSRGLWAFGVLNSFSIWRM